MRNQVTTEELRWAKTCLAAGDTLEEVAEWSRRPISDWELALGPLAKFAATQRRRLALWDLGYTTEQIAAKVGMTNSAVNQGFTWLRAKGLPVPKRRQRARELANG